MISSQHCGVHGGSLEQPLVMMLDDMHAAGHMGMLRHKVTPLQTASGFVESHILLFCKVERAGSGIIMPGSA